MGDYSTIYVGLDVHKLSFTAVTVPDYGDVLLSSDRISSDPKPVFVTQLLLQWSRGDQEFHEGGAPCGRTRHSAPRRTTQSTPCGAHSCARLRRQGPLPLHLEPRLDHFVTNLTDENRLRNSEGTLNAWLTPTSRSETELRSESVTKPAASVTRCSGKSSGGDLSVRSWRLP